MLTATTDNGCAQMALTLRTAVAHCGAMTLCPDEVEEFEAARGRLEAIAYRMLGSASDAEDAVQDTFLRWQSADREHIETPVAWLTKVITNLCLNHLASARTRRETYVGQWLPEPVLAGDSMLGPSETVEQRDQVSLAMLTLMERLSPTQRAVYVLREAFGHSHAEIAEILDLTEANSQQLHHRAKQHVARNRARVEVDAAAARTIVEEFLAAALSGETEPLITLLTRDAVSVSDGGGHVPARRSPVTGTLAIARFLRGLFKPTEPKRAILRDLVGGDVALHAGVANGDPAVLAVVDDQVVGVFALTVTPDGVSALHIQANPAKLLRVSRQWTTDGTDPVVSSW